MLTRRQLLKAGAFGPGAAIALSFLGLTAARSGTGHTNAATMSLPHGGHGSAGVLRVVAAPPPSPATVPFQVPLPIPPTLAPVATDATTDYYEMTMRQAQVAMRLSF